MTELNERIVVLGAERADGGIAFRAKPTMSAKDFGALSNIDVASTNLFELYSRVIRNTLIAEERPRWDALWEEDLPVPFTFKELDDMTNKLVVDESNRPTLPPSPSGTTGGSTKTNSMDASASREAVASAISTSGPVST